MFSAQVGTESPVAWESYIPVIVFHAPISVLHALSDVLVVG